MYSASNLLMKEYWFNQPLEPITTMSLVILVGLCGTLIFAAIFLKYLANRKETDKLIGRGLSRLGGLLAWMGATGFLLTFFRFESAAFFSRRFWLAIWLLSFLAWLIFVFKYFCVKMPVLRKTQKERDRLKKYLP